MAVASYICVRLQSLLLRMPGINTSNVKFLMNRVENLHEISTMSLDRLKVCLLLLGYLGSVIHACAVFVAFIFDTFFVSC